MLQRQSSDEPSVYVALYGICDIFNLSLLISRISFVIAYGRQDVVLEVQA